jgi:CubicO group peptidase (beta-lactamase class C family)
MCPPSATLRTILRALLGALPLAAVVPSVAATLAAQTPHRTRARVAAALDSIAGASVTRGETAGLAVVVLHGRDTLLARGYGRADLARGDSMTVGHVFPIASLTKQLTAAAVLRLVEQGTVGLDDPITRHLPDAPVQGRRVTIRQLLTHTSGLPDFADRPDPDSTYGREVRPATTLARVRGLPFDFAPGTELRYSNTGYLLLGMLLERHTGVPFAEHVTRTLLRPAGATSAGYCGGRSGATAPVPGYRWHRDELRAVQPLHPSVAHAAGGTHLCASALDLAAWNAALHHGRTLRPASYAEMTRGAVVRGASGDSLRARYGFGVALSELAGRRAVHHGGDVAGYASYLAHLPDDALSVVVLLNTEGPVRHVALVEQLVEAALGSAPAAPARPDGPTRAALVRLTGRYGDGPAAFTLTGDRLAFVWQGGPPEPMRWTGGQTFANGPSRFSFMRRPGALPAVWADLTYVVARWTRSAATP